MALKGQNGVGPVPAPVEKPSVASDAKYLFQDMPVWGWLILLAGIGIVVYFFFRRSAGGTTTGSLPVNTAAGTDTGIGPALTADQTQWQGDFQTLADENAQILSLLQNGQSVLPNLPPSGDPASGQPSDAGGGAGIDLSGLEIPLTGYIPPSDQGNPGTVIADQPLNNGASTGVGPSAGNIIAAIPLTYTGPVLPPNLPSWFVPFGTVGPAPANVQTGIEAGVASAVYGSYPTVDQMLAGPTLAPTPPAYVSGGGNPQVAPKKA